MTLPLLAQMLQIPLSEKAWEVAVQSGFNACLVLLLLGYIWKTLAEMQKRNEEQQNAMQERYEKTLKATQDSQNLLTGAVTNLTLAMPFLPKQFHDHAQEQKIKAERLSHEDANR